MEENMKKRISIILAAIMLLAVMVPAIPVSAAEPTNTWNPAEGKYEISTVDDLKAMYAGASQSVWDDEPPYKGQTIKLMNDIVFNDTSAADWYTSAANVITTPSHFKGLTFDGQGHTIYGFCTDISVSANRLGAGFFGTGNNVTIKNLTLDGYYVAGKSTASYPVDMCGVGSLIGDVELSGIAIIDGCTLKNGVLNGQNNTNVGAVIGLVEGNGLDKIEGDGFQSSLKYAVVEITNTTVEDSVKLENAVKAGEVACAGGIIGRWAMGFNWSGGGNLGRYCLSLDGSTFAGKCGDETYAPVGYMPMTGTDAEGGPGQHLVVVEPSGATKYEPCAEIYDNEITTFQQYPEKFVYAGHTEHAYTAGVACDEDCDVCGAIRTVEHTYDNACDTTCNVCEAERTIEHTYEFDCSEKCNVCGETRETTTAHTYAFDCSEACTVCGETRTTEHTYDNTCDTACNVCAAERTVEHTYDDACDTKCNVCDAERTTEHTFGDDGKCSVCGYEKPAEPADTKEETKADTEAQTTATPADTKAEEKSGCGSSIGVASIAVVMVLALGAVVVSKKRIN